MLRLGVPSFFVLLSQTGARCLLHSSETSVYHKIFVVFFFKGVLDMICQTVKTLMPARAICGGFRAWEESSSSSSYQEAMNPNPKSAGTQNLQASSHY
jgi:hypothetical protein